ncbi:hypothetical protein ACFWPU_01140 [Streptomyces sp. NPDC058471]|uniref:hypothetical protein n=1 Tax=Streptomyces sp. NPDC058471 TaxID=3346516 RepID=UPI00365DF98F
MAQSFQLLPSGDIENDGWSLVGSSVTQVWEVIGTQHDDCYIRSPQYRGSASVSFPIDSDDLPEGAIIDSVTVFIHMKTAAGSGPRSITVNVLSSENMSRYTSRTLYATSAFTRYEVGTYTRDPLGKSWDIHRINKLRLRVFCLNNLFDAIQISQLYVRVNYHVKPKVQVTAPSGTSISPSPLVKWNYSQLEGEPQSKAHIRVFTAQQVSAVNTFNPDTEPPVYDATQVGSAVEHTIKTTLNNDGYRVYVQASSDHSAKSDWAHKDFVVSAPSPGVPGDDNAGLSGTPGVGVPSAIPDTFTSSAQLRMRDASNLMSVQQADFEVPADPLEFTATNATLARNTSKAFGSGTASLSITATSAADVTVESTFIEIAPSLALTLRVQGRAQTTARTCQLYCTFYDETFTEITTPAVVSITDSSTTWKEGVSNVASPSAAVYLKFKYKIVSAANGEIHYIDHCGVMYGTDSSWTDGGHQSHNLLSSYLATGDDPVSNVDAWEQANAASTASRTAVSGTGSHGAMCHQMAYVGSAGALAFRATGTVFTTPTAGTNYTLNKPAGVTDNDLLLAFVTSTEHGTIVPPTGWTAVNTASVDDGSTDVALFVLKRTAAASDPSSWATGKVSASSSRRTAVVVAYSGAAHADDQFIADNVRVDASGEPVHRTQVVNNTDPNAWRVAAFAASDDVAGSTFSANRVAPAGSDAAPIRFVATSSKWAQHSNTSSYTIQKPAGVSSGDLMIASVCFSGEIATINAPSGWTLVRRTHVEFPNSSGGDAHSGDVTVAVLKRTAGSSEPNSWTATHSDWGQPKVSQVAAYRNCADASLQFVAEGAGTAVNTSRVSTPQVSNTDSRAWRVCVFGATTPFQSSWSDGDVSERSDSSSSLDNFPDTVLQFSDSNGQVSTGTHMRTAKINSVSNEFSNVPSGNFFTAAGWIGIIKPLSAPPAQPGNETERVDNNNGSSNPWMSSAVYDSNGVISTGSTSLYGQFTGSAANSMASWIGIIKPSSSVPGGVVSARPNTWIDISDMDQGVPTLAGNKVTVMSSFLGSTDGTPLLGVEFARANQAISDAASEGSVFNTTVWTKSWATFPIPEGATRLRPVLSVVDRIVGDSVKYDRVGLMLGAPAAGETPAWRNGTARLEHPVWSEPVIQYTDDTGVGYHSWTNLPGQKIIPPAFRSDTGQLAYVDHSIIPLNVRKYRVQTLSYGLRGEIFASGWGPESNEVSFTALNWWLKDFTNLSTALRLRVKYEDIAVTTDNTASVFHPLGSDFPIVVTEGYKADSLTISVVCDRQEEAALYRLLRTNRTLLLQSDTDYAWWVRPVDALTVTNLAVSQKRRTTDPVKVITCKFVQVESEE